MTSSSSPWTLLAPLPAIAVGAIAAHGVGVSFVAYAGNVVAVVIGVLAFLAARRATASRARDAGAIVAMTAMALTLVGPAVDDVHRWLRLGPVLLNASMAAVPLLLVALAGGARPGILVVVVVAQLVHVAQPDAGQATVLAIGAVPLLVRRRRDVVVVGGVLAALAALAWTRPDPIAPVAHVEGIIAVIAAAGPVAIVVAVLAGLCLLRPLARPTRAGAVATATLLTTFAVTLAGAFPVPVFGGGAAPVLGWYGLLALARWSEVSSAARSG